MNGNFTLREPHTAHNQVNVNVEIAVHFALVGVRTLVLAPVCIMRTSTKWSLL